MAGIKRKQASEATKATTGLNSKKFKPSPSAQKSSQYGGKKQSRKPEPEPESSATSDSEDEEMLDDDELVSDEQEDTRNPQAHNNGPSKGAPNDANSSREAHAKQRALAKERKAAKPNADIIARSKKLWEKLRRKSHVPKEERKKLVDELFEIVTGRVRDFVFKHDSVRVIQCALKYSNMEQRKMIARELKGEYKSLAESKYAKFLIGKLLVEGDAEIRDMVISEFYGHIKRLINHPEASWILDDTYRGMATVDQKAIMLREFYGPEFAIFASERKAGVTSELSKILEENPEKRKPIMTHCHKLINQLIQKKLTGFTILHDAMLQYYLNVMPGSEEATEFLELIKGDEEGDLSKNLAFTKSGSQLVSLVLARGSAKDRKAILKGYKDTIAMLAHDLHGYKLLLTAYDVVDDTKLTSNTIFPELLNSKSDEQTQHDTILELINHPMGRLSLLYPISGQAKWLAPEEKFAFLSKIHEIRVETSKKDAEVRRNEIVTSLIPYLISVIANRAADLVSTSYGCHFIGDVLLTSTSADKTAALAALAQIASGDATEPEHVSHSPSVARLLKSLVAGGRYDQQARKLVPIEPRLGFDDILYEHIKDHIVDWATGTSSFVVVGLAEADGFTHKKEMLDKLRKKKSALKNAATSETELQKAKREEEAEESKAAGSADEAKGSKDKKRKKGKFAAAKDRPKPTGNAGSRLLLEKL